MEHEAADGCEEQRACNGEERQAEHLRVDLLEGGNEVFVAAEAYAYLYDKHCKYDSRQFVRLQPLRCVA